jgi:hypothetical protein
MRRRKIAPTNRIAWAECSKKQVIEMLGEPCSAIAKIMTSNPEVKTGGLTLFEAYRELAYRYHISFRAYPVYWEDSDYVAYFTFDYTNSNDVVISSNDECGKLKDAQLGAIHNTMYLLKERMETAQTTL